MGSAAESAPTRTNGGLPSSGLPNGGMSGPVDANRLDNYPDPRPGINVSEVSKHWVRIENVDTVVTSDGSLQIASQQRNLKLDKGTIYLLRNSLPQPLSRSMRHEFLKCGQNFPGEITGLIVEFVPRPLHGEKLGLCRN